MPIRILITGTTGDAMPPPYGGIPKVSLLYARTWKQMGHAVAVTFVYKPENADDHGAAADYFFEYSGKPDKIKKLLFFVRYVCTNPALYLRLLRSYLAIYPRVTREVLLYTAYGVFMDGVMETFKPDIVLAQAALIKTFMAAEVAKRRSVPIVYNTYAEVHDMRMGVNKDLDEKGRTKYWSYLLNLSDMVIGMSNCSVGPLMYLPPERVKVFYDTCDFTAYQAPMTDTKQERREFLHLPQDMFLVGMVGAFHHRKGHDHLIKAIALLDKQGLNIGAVICGGSGDDEKWRALARAEGVAGKVFFFRNFSEKELVRLHRSTDLYANLSNSTRSCGLDLALLEAMAAALPVVVYDNGALPSAVPEGTNGNIVPTNDISAVAEAIKHIYLMEPSERERMGKESARIAAKCDVNLTAAIKIGWFREIITKRKVAVR